jgi:zinc transporter, ZIP family
MTERGVRAGWVRVAEAFAWGLIAASSLLLGGLLVLGLPLRRHALGLVMAFGAGVLIP